MPRRPAPHTLTMKKVFIVVMLALAPAEAWPWEQSAQHLMPSDTHQDYSQGEESSTRGNLPTKVPTDTTSTSWGHSWSKILNRRLLNNEWGNEGSQLESGSAGHLSVQGEIADPQHMESKRLYLNGLLEETVAATTDQVRTFVAEANLAFVKTHKTGSTSLAAIMYRYAVRHNLKLSHFGSGTITNLKSSATKTKKSGDVVDVMHYHISPTGQYYGNWNKAVEYYRNIMRFPDRINFVTLFREPRSHLLSYYYYYIEPLNKLSIEEFLSSEDHHGSYYKRLVNPLSAEFGVRTAEALDYFIKYNLPDFKLVILTERLDEGLLVLRHMLRWQMIDVTYFELNQTEAGCKRWDGKLFVDRPHFDDLPREVQEKIDNLTDLDRLLYEAGVKEFEKRYAMYAEEVDEDMDEFQELQTAIQEYLESNLSSMSKPMYENKKIIYEPSPLNYPF